MMTNRSFLSEYREARRLLRVLEEQLDRCGITGCPSGAGSCRLDGTGRGTNHRTADAIQRLDGLEAQYQSVQQALEAMEPRFQQLLKDAWGIRERSILCQYYVQGQPDEQIAECLGISARHVSRLRHQMLARMDAE